MALDKLSVPKGTRDFSPVEMNRRNHIFGIIENIFREYGFLPIETPAMENLSTLTGKYGEEGDKLLFKILNSGDFAEGLGTDDLSDANSLSFKICEKGLRYDLTVPFARYVVQHRNEIVFPFRRYQIQPVWRADRPQKGRYREFYQCDADIIGSKSLLNEVELVQMTGKIFRRLGIAVTIKINNRKILYGIAESIGCCESLTDITVAMDKLDKIGFEAVKDEMISKGIPPEAVDKLKPILELRGDASAKLEKLKDIIGCSETGMKGLGEVAAVFDYIGKICDGINVELDLSLARGLNYYTGAIFEVKARDFEIGSICGGGRYDDLTGIFGMPDTSGVGISFGADRIYDVMLGLGLFPEETGFSAKAFFVNFGGREELCALGSLAELRDNGVSAEIYPEAAKIKKQLDYANKRGIPYVIIIGSEEVTQGCANIRNMLTGGQEQIPLNRLAEKLK